MTSTPKTEIRVKADAKLIAANRASAQAKAKAEADAKAKLNAQAKADADAKAQSKSNPPANDASKKLVSKKTTITCIKGKSVKKITSINPGCPKGYKKK